MVNYFVKKGLKSCGACPWLCVAITLPQPWLDLLPTVIRFVKAQTILAQGISVFWFVHKEGDFVGFQDLVFASVEQQLGLSFVL